MKIGKPFDPYACIHLGLADLQVGMEVQLDDQFNCFTPFAILAVQQHSDGRLFLTRNDGTPFFLDDHADECGDNPGRALIGLYDVDPQPWA